MPESKTPAPNGVDDQRPPTIQSPVNIRSAALTVLLVLATIYLLQYAQPVLIPIVLAVLVSYLLLPIVTLLQRIWVPRFLGAAVAVALLVAGLSAAVWSVTDDAIRIVDDLPRAARQMRETIRQQRVGREETPLEKVQEAATELEKTAVAAAPASRAASGVQRVQVVEPAFNASDYLWWGSMGLVGFATEVTMILFLVYFLLVTGDLYKRKLVTIGGTTLARKKITVQILDDVNGQIERYLLTLLLTSVLVAALTAAVLWWLGLREWLFWGIAAGILNTIPYFGPVIVSGGLFVVAYLQFNDLVHAVWISAAAMAITSLEGWFLAPALMGRAGHMNPVAIFVGLLFWSWVWGAWGVILAVPMMMMFKAICDRVEDLQPVAELIGD